MKEKAHSQTCMRAETRKILYLKRVLLWPVTDPVDQGKLLLFFHRTKPIEQGVLMCSYRVIIAIN